MLVATTIGAVAVAAAVPPVALASASSTTSDSLTLGRAFDGDEVNASSWAPDSYVDHSTIVVRLRGSSPAQRISADTLNPRIARTTSGPLEPLGGPWVRIQTGHAPQRALDAVRSDPAVAYANFDLIRTAHGINSPSLRSGDPAFARHQEYLKATMDFPQAWQRSSGRGVRVAVIDSGVDRSHPDLGMVLRGRDFVKGGRVTNDPNGHGTFVAGIVAAKRSNGRGIAGASRASILPVRVLDARGYGRDSDVARGIRWASDHGADVINLSLGGPRGSRLLTSAVKHAERRGALVIASSGNSGGTREIHPAAVPKVVAVGATDNKDRLTWFSQHGSWLDLVAPGFQITSTTPGNGYGVGSGTSFSAPLVAGAAALLVDAHPRWSPVQLRQRLLWSAADAGPVGPDPATGFGVVDVDGALGGPASVWAQPGLVDGGLTPTDAIPLDASTSVRSRPEGMSTWFTYQGNSRLVSVLVRTDAKPSGVLRNDLVMSVYDAEMQLIDRIDRKPGPTPEFFEFRVDGASYVEVSNRRPTRLAGNVIVKVDSTPSSRPATEGTGPKPLVIDSSPRPNTTGVSSAVALEVLLGRKLAPSSVDDRRVRLVDGSSGVKVPASVLYDSLADQLIVTPNSSLAAHREYALVIDGVRTPAGDRLPSRWIGFRTGT